MNNLIVIIGPTAVGKTKISIDLATRLGTEIVSGDSMLVYRGMNIGTAKPDETERKGITHHLIDILEPNADFSVVDFVELAGKKIEEINTCNKIPILAGGTGLYVKALLEGYKFNSTSSDDQYRAGLEQLAKTNGNQYLHNMLREVLPETANRLHPNDQKRIIRALEVYRATGDSVSQEKVSNEHPLIYNAAVIGLTMNREILYQRINQRVDEMFNNGLIEEVATLLQQGISPTSQSMHGIGYKEVAAYLHGENDLPSTISRVKQATRNFAKRQLTWYRKMDYIHWVDSEIMPEDKLIEEVYKYVVDKFSL